MTHYPRPRKEPYAGRILDGPHAGDWLESHGHFEELYWQQRIEPQVYGAFDHVQIDRVFYIWLPTYRAWAWLQPPKIGKKNG